MRTFRNVALVLVALLCAADAFGQNRSPAMSQLPWWDYRPERISNDYNTIIGQSGTTLIRNSTGRSWTSYNNDMGLSLPFPFNFMRTNYPQGYDLRVYHFGLVSFSGYGQSTDPWCYSCYQPSTYYWAPTQTSYRSNN